MAKYTEDMGFEKRNNDKENDGGKKRQNKIPFSTLLTSENFRFKNLYHRGMYKSRTSRLMSCKVYNIYTTFVRLFQLHE